MTDIEFRKMKKRRDASSHTKNDLPMMFVMSNLMSKRSGGQAGTVIGQ